MEVSEKQNLTEIGIMRNQSIVTKITASVCGIVSVLLIIGGSVLLKFEINLVKTFMNEHLEKINQTIDDREKEELSSLRQNVRFNTEILCKTGAIYLLNWDTEHLKNSLLRPYMNYAEILAIKVSDGAGEPFAAAWKTVAEVIVADAFPDTLSLNKSLSFQLDSIYDGEKVGSFQVFYSNTMLTKKIEKVKNDALWESETFHKDSRIRLNRAILTQIIGILIILLVMIICLIIFLRVLVLRPLDMVSAIALRLADFDLTVTIDTERKDEIGMLLSAINKMILEFRKIISEVKTDGKRLADASAQMTENISIVASASEEISVNAHSVSETAAHLSQNINIVAVAIEEMSGSVNTVGNIAEGGSNIAQNAVVMAGKAEKTMTSLGEAAIRISEVTEMIRQIAERTTLLALNADIEAASAGNAGRGFAVVANEIREFARQSTRAAEDIAGRISLMQENSAQAVAVIGDVSGIISNMNSSSEQISFALEKQMKTVDDIASNVLEADTRANGIAASVAQLAQGANEVSMNVGMAARGKESEERDGDASIRYMDSSAAEVARLAGELLELVEKFKVDV